MLIIYIYILCIIILNAFGRAYVGKWDSYLEYSNLILIVSVCCYEMLCHINEKGVELKRISTLYALVK